jgi:hypothetical protein
MERKGMAETKRTTKSIRLGSDHQDLLKLLAAFEGKSEGELVEHAIEAYLHARVLAYRESLGLTKADLAIRPEEAGALVERVRGAMEKALADGVQAPSEEEAAARLVERSERRREKARKGEAVSA